MKKRIVNFSKKKAILSLIIIIILLPAVYKLVRPGFFSMYDDMQVIRLQQMDVCIKDGQIPCRWVPDLGYGYGYPLYQYYAPLPYYVMEAVHLVGFSFIASVKIGFILSVIFSALFFYLFARKFFSKTASLVAMIMYVYSPIRASDLYVRGAMGELWGMATLPLFFLGLERLIRKNDKKSVVIFAVCLASLLISHNLTVIMFAPLILIWIFIRIASSKKKIKIIKNTVFAGILGISLSSFFVIPLIFERNLVHLETLTQGYFNYLAHFATIKQLFFSLHWGYGPSILGPNDDTSLSAGPLHLVVVITSLFVILKLKDKKHRLAFTFLLISFFGATFLSHQRSTLIWKTLPFLSYLQFPWRFLIVASFCSSVLGGLVFENISKKWKNHAAIIFIITILIVYGRFFTPKDWFPLTDNEKLSGQMLERQLTASIYDYLPRSAKKAPGEKAPESLIIKSGDVDVLQSSRGSDWFSYTINVKSDDAQAVIPTYDFPEWNVYVDDENVQVKRTGELGLLGFKVLNGKYEIKAQLTKSQPRKVGDFLSILGLLVLGIVVSKSNHNEKIKSN